MNECTAGRLRADESPGQRRPLMALNHPPSRRCRRRHRPPWSSAASPKSTSVPSPYRLDWASLLVRVFGVEVLKCSRCQGKMRLIACIEEPDVAKTF
jgi:hypothetical protein